MIPRGLTTGARPPSSPFARLLTVKIVLVLFFTVIAARLVQIQVLEASRYREMARRQYQVRMDLPATRGNIYDRNGRILVSNTMHVSFAADPVIVGQNASDVAALFSRVFGSPRASYLAGLREDGRRFVYLARRVDPRRAAEIHAGDLEGVIRLDEPVRVYHYEEVAGQLLGFTDIDNRGLSGVELQFDRTLSGTSGSVILQRDGLGRKRPSVDYPRVEPVNGRSLMLTIDLDLQSIAEEELKKGVERNKAENGLVVMMDPATGEILAMANAPQMNPNHPAEADQARQRNRCITDMVEPGSLFKIVTAAAALEHGIVRPEQEFFAEQGTYVVRLPGGRSRTINDTHPYGRITFQEAVEVSSNIVMAKISDLIGAERFYTMARDFGFGTPTGLELPGEASGELKKPTAWSGTTLNSMSYGYEVAVTPLQIAAAYAAVANGGVLVQPHILRQVIGDNNDVLEEARPHVIRRVITPETANTLSRFLEGVVERGTAVQAKIPALRVAGKTGTARKVVDGRYASGKYMASFAGFFPADNPKLVCVVMLDNPAAGSYYGGTASAPIFRAIAEKVIATSSRFLREPPLIVGRQALAVPDVVSLPVEAASHMLSEAGFDVTSAGEGEIVRTQSPLPGTRILRGETVRLSTGSAAGAATDGYAVVPNLNGMTIRRALTILADLDLTAEVRGSGVVADQNPRPGQNIRTGAHVALRCTPRSLAAVNVY